MIIEVQFFDETNSDANIKKSLKFKFFKFKEYIKKFYKK